MEQRVSDLEDRADRADARWDVIVQALGRLATKDDLNALATKDDLNALATKDDLNALPPKTISRTCGMSFAVTSATCRRT